MKPYRLITLDDLRRAGACPYGQWSLQRAHGGALVLTEEHVEWGSRWLEWMGHTLPARDLAAIRRDDRERWREAAARLGVEAIHLPPAEAAALREEQVRAVLRAVIAAK
jgi:hypothetical protein